MTEYLRKEIKGITEFFNIPNEHIDDNSIKDFIDEHAGHLGYEIILGRLEDRAGLEYIRLKCQGGGEECLHQNIGAPEEMRSSIIYDINLSVFESNL